MNTPTIHNHQTPRAPRWTIPALAVALLTGGIAGMAITSATTVPETVVETEIVADASCLAAIDYADQAIDLYSQANTHAADALTAYTSGQYALMDDHTVAIGTIADELHPVLSGYYNNEQACNG